MPAGMLIFYFSMSYGKKSVDSKSLIMYFNVPIHSSGFFMNCKYSNVCESSENLYFKYCTVKMTDVLFQLDDRVVDYVPNSMLTAMKLATKILRSNVQIKTFCELYQCKDGSNHIDITELTQVISQNGLIKVDKIRSMPSLNSRACALRNFDPWKVYFNPLMLLEMHDRELDEQNLQNTSIDAWEDLTIPLGSAWKAGHSSSTSSSSSVPQEPVDVRNYNSLAFAHQLLAAHQQKQDSARIAAEEADAQLQQQMEERFIALEQSGRSLRPRPEPPQKKARTDPPEQFTPSKLTVFQKNVTMLTVLLVHESNHLLNFALSKIVKEKGETPEKKFAKSDSSKFSDVGHLMERSLYGYSIQHGYDPLVAHPFAIDEILGMKEQTKVDKFVLEPCARFLAMIDNPDAKMDEELTLEDLAFDQTSEVAFVQVVIKAVVLARPSEDASLPTVTSPTALFAAPQVPTTGAATEYDWLSEISFFQYKE